MRWTPCLTTPTAPSVRPGRSTTKSTFDTRGEASRIANSPCSTLARARRSHSLSQRLRDRLQVLVAAAGEADEHDLVLAQLRRQLLDVGDGVRRLEGGDDALGAAQTLERRQRLVVRNRLVAGALAGLEVGVLRADAGVVEAGGDAVRSPCTWPCSSCSR